MSSGNHVLLDAETNELFDRVYFQLDDLKAQVEKAISSGQTRGQARNELARAIKELTSTTNTLSAAVKLLDAGAPVDSQRDRVWTSTKNGPIDGRLNGRAGDNVYFFETGREMAMIPFVDLTPEDQRIVDASDEYWTQRFVLRTE